MKSVVGLSLFFALVFAVQSVGFARALVSEGYAIGDIRFLKALSAEPELTIDHVRANSFEVYGPAGLGAYLQRIHAPFTTAQVNTHYAANYPTPEQVGAELAALAQAHPQTARLFSIGKSVQGRDLWVMKVSRNVGVDDHRPEFKFIANMHGDEIVGRELMVRLLRDLLENDGKDQFVSQLLNDVQIYIMPSMNPDGANAVRRGNARGVDLNRDFPDFTTKDNQETLENRAPETQAVMRWEMSRHFALSANFHGGAEVVNYPWDAIPAPHPQLNIVKSLSLEYAHNAPYIAASTEFQNGITNGYAWYLVNGGMQDWSDHYHGDLQLTIELSNTKYPSFDRVGYYEQQNRQALLTFMGRIRNLVPSYRH